MEKPSKKDIFLSLVYLTVAILIILRNIYYPVSKYSIYWFCDFAGILLAFGFLFKNKSLLKSLVYIGFLPQVFYLIYTFFFFVFNMDLFGLHILESGLAPMFLIISITMHIIFILSFFFTLDSKPQKKVFIYSIILLSIMFITSYLLTPIEQNINYVFIFETLFSLDGLTLLWVPLYFLIIIIPTYYLQILIYNIRHKKS